MTHPIGMFMLGAEPKKCPSSAILPADFMTSNAPSPLPSATSSEEKKTNLWPWLIGGTVAIGAVLLVSGNLPLLANPRTQFSDVWERAYREALRAGLSRSEAEEYAYEEARGAEYDSRVPGWDPDPEHYKSNPSQAEKTSVWRTAFWAAMQRGHNEKEAETVAYETLKKTLDQRELARGTKHEFEHTDDPVVAERTAMDHIVKDRLYYTHLSAMERKYKKNPKDAGPPYTIEMLNSLLGTRQHQSKSPHATLESARNSAKLQASRVRKFASYNILDSRGNVVESFQGVH